MALAAKTAKSEKIKSYISEKVKSGEYRDRIPSLNQLAGYFDVNIKTAKRAVQELEDEGLLYSRKGKGTFVNVDSFEARPLLFVGRENKEISSVISSELSGVIADNSLNYCPCSFLLPARGGNLKVFPLKLERLAGVFIECGLTSSVDLAGLDVPIVKLHCIEGKSNFNTVGPDVNDGVKQALQYLKNLGHRKIAYLGPLPENTTQQLEHRKRQAFFDNIELLGLETSTEWNLPTYYRVKEGYKSAMRLLN